MPSALAPLDPRVVLAAQWLNLIELRRNQFGLSLEALAGRAGVSAQTLTNLRKGGMPQKRTLAALQDALDLSSDIDLARQRIHEAGLQRARDAVARESVEANNPAAAESQRIAIEAVAALAESRLREFPELRHDILKKLVVSADQCTLDRTLGWLRDLSSSTEPDLAG
ncbi:MAG TPA: helix-turn-helix domain-containing protein [Nocardioides sp.]|nr:helix-turn-helix domain-containing protein [Nocardioides sp.]